ncbi:MAG: DnaJ C-terminal domain-containing protein [Pseudomonadales bacterium]|jgi:curved DNA-binding protein|nr:DnaJ C-terminal domain-containing protein [Pseudomonadales bacterium]
MEFKDYYGVLGVAPEAPRDEIRKAYRKLARRYHPDVSEEADAEARFKDVNEAWEILGDEEKRATYDQMRAYGPQGPGDFSQFGGFRAGDGESFADFFESVFSGLRGEGGAAFSFGGSGRPGGGPQGFGRTQGDPFAAFRGAGGPGSSRDVTARLTITLEEAYAGAEKLLRVSIPQPSGPAQSKTLKVRIPAGVTDGRQIRLRGQGHPDPRGGAAGDLFVEVGIAPHDRFVLDGRNVTLAVPLAPWEAALGGRIKVATLGGPVEVKVPAGTGSGGRLRLRGRGLPGEPAGDQYLEFRIVVPATLSDEERTLLERLAACSPFDPRGDGGARRDEDLQASAS